MLNRIKIDFNISLLLVFISCNINTPPCSKSILTKHTGTDTTYYHFGQSHPANPALLKSNLPLKLKRLKDHKLISHVQDAGAIKKESSIVFKAIAGKEELCDSYGTCYKVSSLQDFVQSIHRINYVKVQVHERSKDKLISPATIEEIIFRSEEDAKTLLRYINLVRDVEYFWETIDKYRSDMFRENNKIYFVRKTKQKIHTGDYPLKIVRYLKE